MSTPRLPQVATDGLHFLCMATYLSAGPLFAEIQRRFDAGQLQGKEKGIGEAARQIYGEKGKQQVVTNWRTRGVSLRALPLVSRWIGINDEEYRKRAAEYPSPESKARKDGAPNEKQKRQQNRPPTNAEIVQLLKALDLRLESGFVRILQALEKLAITPQERLSTQSPKPISSKRFPGRSAQSA